MKRNVMLEMFTNGVSIFHDVTPKIVTHFKQKDKMICGQVIKDYQDTDMTSTKDAARLKIVKYSLARYCDIDTQKVKLKEEETIRFKREDKAKHLMRLAIIYNNGDFNRAVVDDLLYVSECHCGFAVACVASSHGSKLVLLNERGQIVWHIGKRCTQMNKIDEKTGLTNRQLLKQFKRKSNKV